jgi:hypothetical protein
LFDVNKITVEIVSNLLYHLQWRYLGQLWFAPPDVLGTSGQPHPAEQSPLREMIETLCRVVNDQPKRDDMLTFEVMGMTQSIMETLYASPLEPSYTIPDTFWTSELGQLVMQAQLWARGDELVTLTEAARVLRGSAETRDLVYVNDLIARGKLTRYLDPSESNPQRAGRVSRQQVEALRNG